MIRREFTVEHAYHYNHQSPLRWIISHLMRYPIIPVATTIGYLLANGLFSLIAIETGMAFDLVSTPGTTRGEILEIALIILVTSLIQGVLGIGSAFATEVMAQRLERNAREELYLSLLGKSQTFHNRQHVGDVMARATNDVLQLNRMISPGLALIMESFFITLTPLIAIAFIRLELLIVPLLFLLVFIITLRNYSHRLNPVTMAQRAQFGKMNARLAEAIAGIEVVKAYAQEEREQAIFRENARQYRNYFVEEGRIKGQYLPLLIFGIAFGLAFGHALLLYFNGTITVGQVVAFTNLMGMLHFPTFISLFSFVLIQLGLSGAERILDLITTETELDENSGGLAQPINGDITFEHVTFHYNDRPILKDVSFCARAGETIAIVGQTGSGKTTLTRMVNRIYDTSEGRVLIDGTDVRAWSLHALRSQISTIEQDIFLFSRTIGQNIAFGAPADVSQQEIEQAAREARAHDFIMQFPNGYDTMIGERGVTLSGGQRQRLAIARAFLTNPRILMLDDSTSAIDSATEDQIQRAMRRILKGRTTLLITHRISQIRWADRILVLRRGALVANGTHDELMQTSEDYRRIFARYET